jgi:hypothetical protein
MLEIEFSLQKIRWSWYEFLFITLVNLDKKIFLHVCLRRVNKNVWYYLTRSWCHVRKGAIILVKKLMLV